MTRITEFSIKNYMAVYAMVLIIAVIGTNSFFTLPRESSPDITIPFVIVTTVYPGVSPADMESLVTRKIEKELKSIENIKEMRSSSKESISAITVEFEPSVDIDTALQKVRDKTSSARSEIPSEAEEPVVTEISFSNIPILYVNMSGGYGLPRLKKVADDLKDKIEQIPGVLEARVAGGLEREVQVNVDPARLRYYGLAMQDVEDAIARENVTIPGGSITLGDYKYLVRLPGEFEDFRIIRDIVIRSVDNKPVYVRDLAEVKFGFKETSTMARLNGQECISISVVKRSGENIIEVADAVKALVAQEERSFPRSTKVVYTADQSQDTKTFLSDLGNHVVTGVTLVVITLFFSLGLRAAVFVSLAIPFSLLIMFGVLSAAGITLNMVVLFSIILALGRLVDDAIVVVENIFRHAEEGADAKTAALEGTREVIVPVITSTMTTICGFLPIIFWPGIMGEFMVYIPYTVIIALLASLFVALVINPTMCATMLSVKSRSKSYAQRSEEEMGPLMRQYRRALIWALNHRGKTLAASFGALVMIIAVYSVAGHGVEFFPSADPRKTFVELEAPTGFTVDATDALTRKIEAIVKKYKETQTYVANVGVSAGVFDFSGMGESGPGNKARVIVDFIPREEREHSTKLIQDEIRAAATGEIVGARVRVSAEQMGPPVGAPINIEVFGDDYTVLADVSHTLEDVISKVPGVVDAENNYSAGMPELRIEIDREKAASYGLNTTDVAGGVRAAIYGSKASIYREGKDEYDIRVRYTEDRRDGFEKLKSYFIRHEGKEIPLSAVTKIDTSSGYSDIMHLDQKRVISVGAQVAAGYNSAATLETVKKTVAEKVKLPEGVQISYTGEEKEQKEAETFLTNAFFTAVFLIALVLILEFNSIVTPSIILTSVVLSIIGVLIGLLVTMSPFGIIMTGIGIVSLAGVVVCNAIVLLDYTIKLRERGMPKFDAIVTAGLTRLRPVLLTAITTILGVVPMSLGISFDFNKMKFAMGSDSTEFWGPMADAIVFGMGFATILTLVVVPALYSLLDSWMSRFYGVSLTHDGKDHAQG
ncbi:MAG: efflux RND transporter permease subunit [Nitrospinae bacterium]|nr:efflux RND transporter permease subunit [Nitrospinota bacterium]